MSGRGRGDLRLSDSIAGAFRFAGPIACDPRFTRRIVNLRGPHGGEGTEDARTNFIIATARAGLSYIFSALFCVAVCRTETILFYWSHRSLRIQQPRKVLRPRRPLTGYHLNFLMLHKENIFMICCSQDIPVVLDLKNLLFPSISDAST